MEHCQICGYPVMWDQGPICFNGHNPDRHLATKDEVSRVKAHETIRWPRVLDFIEYCPGVSHSELVEAMGGCCQSQCRLLIKRGFIRQKKSRNRLYYWPMGDDDV